MWTHFCETEVVWSVLSIETCLIKLHPIYTTSTCEYKLNWSVCDSYFRKDFDFWDVDFMCWEPTKIYIFLNIYLYIFIDRYIDKVI